MVLKKLAFKTIKLFSNFTIVPYKKIGNWKLCDPNIQEKYFQINSVLISSNICYNISNVIISDNLLITCPEILDKHELLLPAINYEPFIDFALNSIINIIDYYSYIHIIYPKILTFSNELIQVQLSISDNLFIKFEKPEIKGKIFFKALKRKIQTSKLTSVPKIRKAASQVTNLDQWSLLYPSLCPPLIFDFDDIDFFQRLRSYQVDGINFLINNSSSLLADEMGTGKTVQTVNALRILFRQGRIRCALIICPLAVIGSAYLSEETGKSEGWDGHFYNWAKELLITVIRDNREQRKIDWETPAHIYITTYETLRNDLKEGTLKESDLIKFDSVIIDEAQKIKNKHSGISQAVRKLTPKYRWALTGTPIENSSQDIISIFEFVQPGLFTGGVDYLAQQVKNAIAPYMLRRLKRDVLKDLPEKVYQEDWLELDSSQKAEYDRALSIGRNKLENSINNQETRTHIFALLHKLKKICNFSDSKLSSPKTELLIEYITTISANNEKVLIFSQYVPEGIDKLEKVLEKKGIGFVSYKGGMSETDKNKALNDFRNKPDIYVLLGTFKTIGFGVTLTEASYVIHFDHWWNPAVMQQAEDRAHRIGQVNKLTVYSFWMRDTIEENIKKKLYEKRSLIENIIDPLAEEAFNNIVTTEEWLDMLGVKTKPQQSTTKNKKPLPLQPNNEDQAASFDSTEPMIDFAIITAIEFELKAVCEAFKMTPEHRVRKGSRVYWRNRLELKDGEFYEIVVAQSPDMANVDVALLASDTIHHWHPEAILMVGIAGAASDDPALGDIVVGNAIYYYERGKITPDGLKPEPYQYPVDQTLWSRIISLPDWNGIISVSRPDSKNTIPKIHLGVIASGEQVIADAAMRDNIAAHNRKIVAIEMEGYGVSKAAWQSFERVRHLVIRSICDFADSSKNSEWHPYAAAVAAGYTKHFLLDRPLEPRNITR
ncbi:SNF2-related protein [Anabaena sp. CCY 0017]|uniref:SNF2-related protein n=1 Tax=Anabaena sp. CCY 0017 TaxID=3103866 RepID=UPI0039C6BA10